MKIYIDQPIILNRGDLSLENWEYYLESFERFRKDFVVFSTRDSKEIRIHPQKISLPEESAAEFLEIIEEFWKNSHLTSNIKDVKYRAETDRITVSIEIMS